MGNYKMRNGAVFLDRDGVINELVYYNDTNEYESPRSVADISLKEGVVEAIIELNALFDYIFVISNQPSYAKGKIVWNEAQEVIKNIEEQISLGGAMISDFFYCYHHPYAKLLEFKQKCSCRKPGIKFIEIAAQKYKFIKEISWLIGDQDSDILCGKNAGLKTILIEDKNSVAKRGKEIPNFKCASLLEAVKNVVLDVN